MSRLAELLHQRARLQERIAIQRADLAEQCEPLLQAAESGQHRRSRLAEQHRSRRDRAVSDATGVQRPDGGGQWRQYCDGFTRGERLTAGQQLRKTAMTQPLENEAGQPTGSAGDIPQLKSVGMIRPLQRLDLRVDRLECRRRAEDLDRRDTLGSPMAEVDLGPAADSEGANHPEAPDVLARDHHNSLLSARR